MLLHVDPDEDSRSSVRDVLSEAGIEIRSIGSAGEAMATIEGGERVDLLVTEYDLGDGTGLELLRAAREAHPDVTGILYTVTPLADIESAGFEDLVVEYVDKRDAAGIERLREIVTFESRNRSQVSYPRPANESDRLAALSEYPTTSPEVEVALDRLTELAAVLFDVDTAFTGIIDESKERFISCYNAAYDELDRGDTVCTFTILEDSLTVIEDIREDPRFNTNELYAGDGIRFYAGAPLRTSKGEAIGTFCLVDDQPRSLSADDRHHLELFAATAMEYLELHRQLDGVRVEDAHVE